MPLPIPRARGPQDIRAQQPGWRGFDYTDYVPTREQSLMNFLSVLSNAVPEKGAAPLAAGAIKELKLPTRSSWDTWFQELKSTVNRNWGEMNPQKVGPNTYSLRAYHGTKGSLPNATGAYGGRAALRDELAQPTHYGSFLAALDRLHSVEGPRPTQRIYSGLIDRLRTPTRREAIGAAEELIKSGAKRSSTLAGDTQKHYGYEIFRSPDMVGSLERPLSDGAANYLAQNPAARKRLLDNGVNGMFYMNNVEDKGNLSVLLLDPSAYRPTGVSLAPARERGVTLPSKMLEDLPE